MPSTNKEQAHTDAVCAFPRLQPRLQCLADCAGRCRCLADVGTDHGYLPVWLLQNGRTERAVASDINAEPLAHARRTAERYGVSDKMDFRLCAGLAGYAPGEADVLVMAGMGGETIRDILASAPWVKGSDARLLLQPMTRSELLRPWLAENGYGIRYERLVMDKGTIYTVIEAAAGAGRPLTAAECWCGVGLEHDPLYGAYASDRVRKLERAAGGLRQAKTPDSAQINSLEADAAALRRKIEEWEHGKGT